LGTLEYWIYHRGAWFVSLILVLYLLTPALYILATSKSKWLYTSILIAIILLLCNQTGKPIEGHDIQSNILFALCRAPSYLIGLLLGQASMENKKISCVYVFIPIVLFIVIIKCFSIKNGLDFLVVPFIVWVSVSIIRLTKRISIIQSGLRLLGTISLESYLTNITLNSILGALIPAYIVSPLFKGRWLEYAIVIIVGLLLAYCINRVYKLLYTSNKTKYMTRDNFKHD